MKKRIALMVISALVAVSGYAQFEEGKSYVGANLTGLDFSYSGAKKFSGGVGAQLGYFLFDDFMVLGDFEYQRNGIAKVGYAFFIDGHVTIEPALYYQQSFKSHKDYSSVGFRIGFGYTF